MLANTHQEKELFNDGSIDDEAISRNNECLTIINND